MSEVLGPLKPRYIVVDSYMEALDVWLKLPYQSVLLIGTNNINNLKMFDFKRVTIMVQNFEDIEELKRIDKPIKIHIKLNTGMNRQGFDQGDLEKLKKIMVRAEKIEVEGIMSHLAKGANLEETKKQENMFLEMVDHLDLSPQFLHLGATEGITTVKNKRINAFRLGLGIYRGAIRWKSTIIKIRWVKKGEGVGYDLSQKLKQDGWVGLIAAGYYEGVDRRLSGKGWVKYKDKYYPIIGRISMNMMSVNFGNIKPKLWEGVEIVEAGVSGMCSVDKIAQECQTIPYEILVKLNPKLKRVII
jgi:alanine racemase